MKSTDQTKEVLKRILQGTVSRQEAEKLLRAGGTAQFHIVHLKDNGRYSVDDLQDLTEQEMRAHIYPKMPITIIIPEGMPPIAHSEKDIVL